MRLIQAGFALRSLAALMSPLQVLSTQRRPRPVPTSFETDAGSGTDRDHNGQDDPVLDAGDGHARSPMQEQLSPPKTRATTRT